MATLVCSLITLPVSGFEKRWMLKNTVVWSFLADWRRTNIRAPRKIVTFFFRKHNCITPLFVQCYQFDLRTLVIPPPIFLRDSVVIDDPFEVCHTVIHPLNSRENQNFCNFLTFSLANRSRIYGTLNVHTDINLNLLNKRIHHWKRLYCIRN